MNTDSNQRPAPIKPGSRIITHEDPEWLLLDAPSAEVADIRAQVVPHIQTMRRLMESHRGMSLAGVQVALPLRFFIFGGKFLKTPLVTTVINPRILQYSEEKVTMKESLIALPGVKSDEERSAWVEAEWTDTLGEPVQRVVEGMLARIFQFNVDLLDGKAMQR